MLLGHIQDPVADAVLTALASPAMSDAANPQCPFEIADAVAVWIGYEDPYKWIPSLCDELNRLGFKIERIGDS
jgi:hydroxyethylthiazole kinase-like sugar kinase family protein